MAADNTRPMLRIEVVLAMPEKQELVTLNLDAGSTIADAIERSGIVDLFEDFVFDPARVGIFGQKAPPGQELRDGDRVEIYRPLVVNPKEERRQRALEQGKG